MTGPEDNPADEHQPTKEEWDEYQMAKSYEHCCQCDALTGRAGKFDDSIYVTMKADGDYKGPFCEDCYKQLIADGLVEEDS